MTRAFIASGVLGLGTAIVFGAAMLASVLFPNGGTVNVGWNQWGGGVAVEKAVPMPAAIDPDIVEKQEVEPMVDPLVKPGRAADDEVTDTP